ncbi:Putative ribonuclease H protein At1g65750 [Linum perenne]
MLPEMAHSATINTAFSDWWNRGLHDGKMKLIFGVTAWVLWKRRNRLIFHSENITVSEVCHQVKFWVHLYSSSWKTLQASQEAPSIAQQAQLIGWWPAGEGWFSLNSDGSAGSNSNRAAAGGVICDEDGRLISAFAANLGTCSIMRAELRGIVEGMKLAWDKGIRKLRIQTNSKASADMLSDLGSRNNKHTNLLNQFSELLSREWLLSIHHIYREANFAADYLANLGQSLQLGVHVLDSPKSALADWLRFDLVGGCMSRLIINNM